MGSRGTFVLCTSSSMCTRIYAAERRFVRWRGRGWTVWSTCSRWWTAGTSRSGCLFTTDARFLCSTGSSSDWLSSEPDSLLLLLHSNTVSYTDSMPCAHVIIIIINLSECLLPGPRTELPGPVPGQGEFFFWTYFRLSLWQIHQLRMRRLVRHTPISTWWGKVYTQDCPEKESRGGTLNNCW